MARQDHDVFYGLPHVKIARLYADGYGMSALCERYHWASIGTLGDAVVYGRGILRREAGLPPQRPADRKTSIVTEEAIIAAAVAAGGIDGIGKRFGVSANFVMTVFWERGLDYPRKDNAVRGKSVRAAFEARRLANGFPPITADSLRADLTGGADLPAMAAKYGISVDTVGVRARELGVAVVPPRLDRRAALRAYESGESVRSIAERAGKTIDYVRRVLSELGAFKPHAAASQTPPKSKGRGRLAVAALRTDVAAGLTVRQIADRHGVAIHTVRCALSREKLSATRAKRFDRRAPASDVIAARRAAGERVKDLAAEFGVSSALISKHLKSARASA
jgi:transposase